MTYIVIVTGSRGYLNRSKVFSALDNQLVRHKDLNVKVGDCDAGADLFTRQWCYATRTGSQVFSAQWDIFGKAAGIIRNHDMVDSGGDLCLAFPETFSRGTRDCAEHAASRGMPVRFPDLPEWAQWAAPIAHYITDRTGEIHD